MNSPPDFNEKDFANLIDLLCGKGLRIWNNFGGHKSEVEDFKKKNLKGNVFLVIIFPILENSDEQNFVRNGQ